MGADAHHLTLEIHSAGREIADWLRKGFSANLMTYGQGLSGKTKLLFGECEDPAFTRDSLFGVLVRGIFTYAAEVNFVKNFYYV